MTALILAMQRAEAGVLHRAQRHLLDVAPARLLHQLQHAQLSVAEFELFVATCQERGFSPFSCHMVPIIRACCGQSMCEAVVISHRPPPLEQRVTGGGHQRVAAHATRPDLHDIAGRAPQLQADGVQVLRRGRAVQVLIHESSGADDGYGRVRRRISLSQSVPARTTESQSASAQGMSGLTSPGLAGPGTGSSIASSPPITM
mgnify:CR=1 FL=1